MRRLVACVAVCVGVLAASLPRAQGGIRVLPVRGNVYVLAGAGANVVASVGRDGVMLVDSGAPKMSDPLLAAVQDLARRVTASPAPLRACVGLVNGCDWWTSSEYLPTTAAPRAPRPVIGVVNTSDDPDHVAGNALLSSAGKSFGVRNIGSNSVPGAWVIAHENVNRRLSSSGQTTLTASETFFTREKKLNFINGEGVVVTHQPQAHTDGDSMVYFRGSDVLAAGDILNMSSYPVIDVARGGTIQGVVDALNWILDVAVVEHMMEGGTMIVPGHGRIVDSADVAYYRDMMTIFRDRVSAMRDKKMTLEQITLARPTRDYDGRFGKNPAWTPAMLVEAIYKTLPAGPS